MPTQKPPPTKTVTSNLKEFLKYGNLYDSQAILLFGQKSPTYLAANYPIGLVILCQVDDIAVRFNGELEKNKTFVHTKDILKEFADSQRRKFFTINKIEINIDTLGVSNYPNWQVESRPAPPRDSPLYIRTAAYGLTVEPQPMIRRNGQVVEMESPLVEQESTPNMESARAFNNALNNLNGLPIFTNY